MSGEEIDKYLHDLGISPSFINFERDIIPPAKIWYSVEKNAICSDCGVELPYNYLDNVDAFQIIFDMEEAILNHFGK